MSTDILFKGFNVLNEHSCYTDLDEFESLIYCREILKNSNYDINKLKEEPRGDYYLLSGCKSVKHQINWDPELKSDPDKIIRQTLIIDEMIKTLENFYKDL